MGEKDKNSAHEIGVRLRKPELALIEELICKLTALALENEDIIKSVAYMIAAKILYEEVRRAKKRV